MKRDMPQAVKGLDFSGTEIQEAVRCRRMLQLDLDIPYNCDLYCCYCDRITPERRHGQAPQKMTLQERTSVVSQAAELGTRAVLFPGAGEPLIRKDFFHLLEHIASLDIIPVVFTNGSFLDPCTASTLYQLGATVMLKSHGFNAALHDKSVAKPGHFALHERALNSLLEQNFNANSPPRMGLSFAVTKENIAEAAPTYRFCADNNIFPLFFGLIPHGMALEHHETILPRSEVRDLFADLASIDRSVFGRTTQNRLPFARGFSCTWLEYSLFVDYMGDVWECNAPASTESEVSWRVHYTNSSFRRSTTMPSLRPAHVSRKRTLVMFENRIGLSWKGR